MKCEICGSMEEVKKISVDNIDNKEKWIVCYECYLESQYEDIY